MVNCVMGLVGSLQTLVVAGSAHPIDVRTSRRVRSLLALTRRELAR